MNPFGNQDELIEFIRRRSKKYQNLIGLKKIGAGGEAMIFRIEHTGLDEIVVKVPLFPEDSDYQHKYYEGLFYETQTLKVCNFKDGIGKVKEEIIEFNEQKN